jgi:hypothetical protein
LLTDTEMSCLIDGPSRFCDSEWFSRSAQKAFRLRLVLGERRIEHQAPFHGLAEIGFHLLQKPGLVGAGAARPGRRPFQQHVPLVTFGERIGGAGDVLQNRDRRPGRAISSQEVTLSSLAACAPLSSVTAASGEGTAIHEVATSLGLGQSFRIALVMMPSVPSAPR